MLTQQLVVFSQGQLPEHIPRIQLDTLEHNSWLHEKDFRADPRFELPAFKGFDNLGENGRIYLRCKSTGMIVCAVPLKDSFQVLVFPKKRSDYFKLEVTTSADLLRDRIDVKAIETLLRSIRPVVGMGYDPTINKAALRVRIEAIEEIAGLEKPKPIE
jgi:hypothetical protein